MLDPVPRPDANSGRQRRSAVSGAVGLGILASALVVGLLAFQSYSERDSVIENEKDSLLRLAQIVAVETGDMFEQIKFFFKAADLWLSVHPKADPRFDRDFGRLVDDFRATMKDRVDIRLVSDAGGLFFIPSDGPEPKADVRDRSYYLAQKSPAARGFYIADPVLSRVTGNWAIPISYPLTARNGGIAVIFAALEMPTLEGIYDKIRPKPGGSVSLIRRDGRFLARVPFDEAYMTRRVSEDAEQWWSDIQATAVLTLRATATDQAERIIATKSILDPDIAVNVSSRMEDVLAGWYAMLRWRIATALALIAVISLVSSRLVAAMRKVDAARSELAESVARLRESDATKDKLFSILAHDLRGPIGGICNLLDSMAQDLGGLGAGELEEYISALRIGSWNTYQLLENILAWSRSKRGDMPFRPEKTPLVPLIEECSEVYALAMEGKGVSLDVDAGQAPEARADPDLLKVVLRNLISNALKFSTKGGRIRVSSRRSGPAEGAQAGVLLTVRDEGIGMDAETKAGLFSQGGARSRDGTASERGSGLGLLLCKDIAALHGGRIEAESEIGAGSAFTVFLPDEPSP
jgi:signal transduction histidine kinase